MMVSILLYLWRMSVAGVGVAVAEGGVGLGHAKLHAANADTQQP